MAQPLKAPKPLKLIGTHADDVLTGTSGADEIHAQGGTDRVFAGDGDDVVYGGNGNDFLNGGAGNDVIYGGNGDDILLGRGLDSISGVVGAGGGTNYLYGGNGNDSFNSLYWLETEEFSYIDGGKGTDTFALAFGSVAIADADGAVLVSANGGPRASVTDVEVWASPVGNPGDTGQYIDLHTLTYDLQITGVANGPNGVTHDTLIGGSGDDLFFGAGGSDFINGNGGTDTARFSGIASSYTYGYNQQGQFTVTGQGFLGPETTTLVSIEQIKFDDGSVYTPDQLINLSLQQPTSSIV